jgi:pyridoxine 5-phosphate synthase
MRNEFNIEGYPSDKFIDLVLAVMPDQVTLLVPDAHDAITSNAGWDIPSTGFFLTDVISTFRKEGIRTSIFVDTLTMNIENAGTDRH